MVALDIRIGMDLQPFEDILDFIAAKRGQHHE